MTDNPDQILDKAQALEKQAEIDRLKREKEELEQRLRRLQLEREVWEAINEMRKQNTDAIQLQEQSLVNVNSLKEKIDSDINIIQQKCTALGKLQEKMGIGMNSLKDQVHNNINEQEEQNRLFRLSIKGIDSQINQMETAEISGTERYDSVGEKVESISRRMKRETILIIGGERGGLSCKTMLVLSGDRIDWIELQLELPYEAFGSGAVYLNGEIYLFGGINTPNAFYKLDKNMEWIRLADMNEERAGITNSCLEWNGYIWVIGGWNEKREPLKSVERYDPKENKWTQMPDMETVRSWAATALWNDKIIISGGWIAEKTFTKTMECFNPEVGCWVEFPDMMTKSGGHSLVSYNNKLILIGGTGKGTYNTVWELDPLQLNARWKRLPPMKYLSYQFPGIVLDNEIYAIGGFQGRKLPVLSRVEIFDGKNWRDGPDLPYTWVCMSAVIIPQHFADRLCAYKP